ncbi:MAG: hypothetical protein GWN00_35100, partial [Aliifodinibius sp.]|nr:hypothetical protein [Fodinibius sp.]NIV15881.1 hypothetical protein [Fodinibius sp.]NIY29828.1 hypothetical protein [Fodinibius sp.]
MKIKACSWFILVTLLFMILSECSQSSSETPATLVNTAHLDHLYQEIVLDSLPAALIYIYADHPDYHWVAAEGEGIACVDDVARAAVFYLRHYAYFQEEASLRKARKLLQFVLDMQAENGQFYNFVYEDLSINKTRHNSRARADWWTWRALWALAEGNSVYQTIDPGFARQLSESIEKTLPTIDSLLQHYPEATYYQEFIQ